MSFSNPIGRLFVLLETIRSQGAESLAIAKRTETKMSALTDAVTSLTAADRAEHEELVQVLELIAGWPAKLQAGIDAALAAGAPPEVLADIKTVTDSIAKDHQTMVDALATPPPPSA